MIISEAPGTLFSLKTFYPIGPPIQTAQSTIEFVFDAHRHVNVALKTTLDDDLATHEANVLQQLMSLGIHVSLNHHRA